MRSRKIALVAGSVTFCSLLTFIPKQHFLLEINSALGGYYLLAHSLILCWLLLARRELSRRHFRIWLVVQLFLLLYYAAPLRRFSTVPLFGRASPRVGCRPDTIRQSRQLSLFFANVQRKGYHVTKFRDEIVRRSPDIVALLEIDSRWISELNIAQHYPHRIEVPHEQDDFGLALYSRFPLIENQEPNFRDTTPPVIAAVLDVGEAGMTVPLQLFLLHVTSPVSQERYLMGRRTLRRVATVVRRDERPMLVAADMNSTPWSALYKLFQYWTNLRNARGGSGIVRTWHAGNPLLRFMLDHVLVDTQLSVSSAEPLPDLGSDHHGYLVDFRVCLRPTDEPPSLGGP